MVTNDPKLPPLRNSRRHLKLRSRSSVAPSDRSPVPAVTAATVAAGGKAVGGRSVAAAAAVAAAAVRAAKSAPPDRWPTATN